MAASGNRSKMMGFILCILAVMLVVTACGGNKDTANNNTADSGSNGEAGAVQENTSEVRTIKHAMGETDIKGTPKKIVVLTNEGTEALLALGIKPAGAVKSWTGNPWYKHIEADMAGVTELGEEGQPNLELIAGLQPDLIIANKMRHEKIVEQLKGIAPTVVSETLRGEWKNNFKLYADAVNQTAKGEELIAKFDGRVEEFKGKAGDKLKETVSVVRFMAGKTRVYHTNSFSGIIFSQIGITRNEMTLNAKDQFIDEITKERLPEVEADRLFYFTYEDGDGKGTETEQEWIKDPLWKGLGAVKAGKVYQVDDAIWNTSGGILAANLVLDELHTIYEVK
ncbi:ABC transporter substrate-binding protein [Paenibacillus sp. GCM10023252]|uniref:ABC transporter substrate-binding protein n=1 Tax=Paenibacillus sp. GCM10023252 TaxID=3252649 RepID=UPI00361F8841